MLRVDNDAARNWYMEESVRASWSSRQLERQISTLYDDPQQLELGISSMGGLQMKMNPVHKL